METPYLILVVSGKPHIHNYLQTILNTDSLQVETILNGSEALNRVQKEPVPDLILLDSLLPELKGLDVLKKLGETRPNLKVGVVSGAYNPEMSVEVLRLETLDCSAESFSKRNVATCLQSMREDSGRSEAEVPILDPENAGDEQTFFASRAMQRVYKQAALIALVDVPVLLMGERGTGKSSVARLIHKLSTRAQGNFIRVDCAIRPYELLDSELFGYEPGAFIGATNAKPGKFELADQGTVLLDQIGDMPPKLQGKLLHVLQDGESFRLGGRFLVRVNVRIVAAANSNPGMTAASDKVRSDLYYRLSAFTIHIPPLRKRQEEIPGLIKHFIDMFATRYRLVPRPLSSRILKRAMDYSWPGNLYELEKFVEKYLILGDESEALGYLSTPRTGISRQTNGVTDFGSSRTNDLKPVMQDLEDD